MIDRARTAGPVRAVVADATFSKAVQLVRPVEVHATDLHWPVPGRAERVGVRGYGRIERLVVRPDFVFVWEPARDQGHARRDTDRRGAVGRRKTGAAGGQAIEVRRLDHRVAVASRDGRIVLVGLDEQDIRAVRPGSGGVWFGRTTWTGQCDSPGVRKGWSLPYRSLNRRGVRGLQIGPPRPVHTIKHGTLPTRLSFRAKPRNLNTLSLSQAVACQRPSMRGLVT